MYHAPAHKRIPSRHIFIEPLIRLDYAPVIGKLNIGEVRVDQLPIGVIGGEVEEVVVWGFEGVIQELIGYVESRAL